MANSSKPITAEQPEPGEHSNTQPRKKPHPAKPITEEQPDTDPENGARKDR